MKNPSGAQRALSRPFSLCMRIGIKFFILYYYVEYHFKYFATSFNPHPPLSLESQEIPQNGIGEPVPSEVRNSRDCFVVRPRRTPRNDKEFLLSG